eukprot:1158826-Pelagomonas_calceolata.AAC.5
MHARTHTQALGVLLYVLVYGKLPFDGESKLSILFGKYTLPPGKPPVLVGLIKDLLVTDPEQRPNIHQVWSSALITTRLCGWGGAGMQCPDPYPECVQICVCVCVCVCACAQASLR